MNMHFANAQLECGWAVKLNQNIKVAARKLK